MKALSGLRGDVTLVVLVAASLSYSFVAAVGLVRLADASEDAARARVSTVMKQLESDLRANRATLRIATSDGVVATASRAGTNQPPPLAREIRVDRRIDVDGTRYVLMGRTPRAPLADGLRSVHRLTWLLVTFAAAMTALVANLAAKWALAPVAAMTALADRIETSRSTERIALRRGDDEIQGLARTVNQMLDRIAAADRSLRQFSSDAAHELRTPLMALQCELELVDERGDPADSASIQRMRAHAGRLGERVDELLLLSTLDEGRPLRRESIGLVELINEEAELVARDVTVTSVVADDRVEVDVALFRRLLRNLLVNAARHAQTSVEVSVSGDDRRVVLCVDDDGPGVAPEHRVRILARFGRTDEARSASEGGAGLGLAIVVSIARAHDGTVTVEESPRGGARFEVAISRTASSSLA